MTLEELQRAGKIASRIQALEYIRHREDLEHETAEITFKDPSTGVYTPVMVSVDGFFDFMKREQDKLEAELVMLGVKVDG